MNAIKRRQWTCTVSLALIVARALSAASGGEGPRGGRQPRRLVVFATNSSDTPQTTLWKATVDGDKVTLREYPGAGWPGLINLRYVRRLSAKTVAVAGGSLYELDTDTGNLREIVSPFSRLLFIDEEKILYTARALDARGRSLRHRLVMRCNRRSGEKAVLSDKPHYKDIPYGPFSAHDHYPPLAGKCYYFCSRSAGGVEIVGIDTETCKEFSCGSLPHDPLRLQFLSTSAPSIVYSYRTRSRSGAGWPQGGEFCANLYNLRTRELRRIIGPIRQEVSPISSSAPDMAFLIWDGNTVLFSETRLREKGPRHSRAYNRLMRLDIGSRRVSEVAGLNGESTGGLAIHNDLRAAGGRVIWNDRYEVLVREGRVERLESTPMRESPHFAWKASGIVCPLVKKELALSSRCTSYLVSDDGESIAFNVLDKSGRASHWAFYAVGMGAPVRLTQGGERLVTPLCILD